MNDLIICLVVAACLALAFVAGFARGLHQQNREVGYWRELLLSMRDIPNDTVTIDGITISAACFTWFVRAKPGDLFRYVKRDGDGVVTIETVRTEALVEYDRAVN